MLRLCCKMPVGGLSLNWYCYGESGMPTYGEWIKGECNDFDNEKENDEGKSSANNIQKTANKKD